MFSFTRSHQIIITMITIGFQEFIFQREYKTVQIAFQWMEKNISYVWVLSARLANAYRLWRILGKAPEVLKEISIVKWTFTWPLRSSLGRIQKNYTNTVFGRHQHNLAFQAIFLRLCSSPNAIPLSMTDNHHSHGNSFDTIEKAKSEQSDNDFSRFSVQVP